MPARWIDLMRRINYVLDDADDDLTHADRTLFYTHLLETATRRQHHRATLPFEHPNPEHTTTGYRDPTGQ